MVCRYIICIRFSCFNSYVRIRQRNSIHSTSCTLLLFHYFQSPLTSVLQALNLARAAMMNTFIGATVKLIVIFVLASRPEFQMMGVALAIAANIVTVTFLHYATVLKRLHLPFTQRLYFRRTCHRYRRRLRFYIHKYIIFSHSLGIQTLWEITLTTIVYIVLLFTFKLIRKEELSRLYHS